MGPVNFPSFTPMKVQPNLAQRPVQRGIAGANEGLVTRHAYYVVPSERVSKSLTSTVIASGAEIKAGRGALSDIGTLFFSGGMTACGVEVSHNISLGEILISIGVAVLLLVLLVAISSSSRNLPRACLQNH